MARLAAEGRTLPRHIAREFEDFLACGRLENGFLRVACDGCRAERLVAFSCKRRGFCPSCGGVVHRCITSHLVGKAGLTLEGARTGAVTLIQRFGGALNLNVHFHMLFLDGVYVERPDGSLRFRRIGAPTSAELDELTRTITHRIGHLLERRGLLERDAENVRLAGDDDAEPAPIDELRAASVTYRIAIGPRRGSKAFTLRTLPPTPDEPLGDRPGGAGGFSLHAGVATGANERAKLERLCRYISRPALSEKRLSLTSSGRVRYRFKTPWRDGTTDVVLDPLDFLTRLAALVPKPRVNLIRFHGVFAPNSPYRARITPAGRGPGAKRASADPSRDPAERAERLASSAWARRLKRVFGIDIEACADCGGRLRIIACIEERQLVDSILAHLERQDPASSATGSTTRCRAPFERPGARAPSLTGSRPLAHPGMARHGPPRTAPTDAEPTASGLVVPVPPPRSPRRPSPRLATPGSRSATPALPVRSQ